LPLRRRTGAASVAPLVSVDNPAVVVEAVKLADDRSGDVTVRCYEAVGGRARARVKPGFRAAKLSTCDLLETVVEEVPLDDGGATLEVRPFEVRTLRFTASAPERVYQPLDEL
jgi:alpha-mannosidase